MKAMLISRKGSVPLKVGPKTLFALSLSSWPRPGNAASYARAEKEDSVLQLLPPELCFIDRIPSGGRNAPLSRNACRDNPLRRRARLRRVPASLAVEVESSARPGFGGLVSYRGCDRRSRRGHRLNLGEGGGTGAGLHGAAASVTHGRS